MNRQQFAHLCSRTAACLGLQPDAFDASAVVEVTGIDTQLTLNELTGGAYLMFDVGRPRPDLAGTCRLRWRSGTSSPAWHRSGWTCSSRPSALGELLHADAKEWGRLIRQIGFTAES